MTLLEETQKIKQYLLVNPITEINRYSDVGKVFNVEGERIRSVWRSLRSANLVEHKLVKVIPVAQQDPVISQYEKEDFINGTKEIAKVTDEPIKSLQDLVKVCEIDLNVWKIDKYVCNTWANKWQTKAWLSPKHTGSIDYIKEFETFLESKSIKVLTSPTPVVFFNNTTTENTLIINSADLHLGKLANREEVGEDYDLKIASDRFLTTIKALVIKASQGFKYKRIIFSTLGDTLHVDNTKSTTTSGTYVESDTRASKIFSTALDIITEAIDYCKLFADVVEYVNINGNHCELSEQHLGVAIKAYYRNDKKVLIDATPKNRKYKMVGENLLVYSHGDCRMNDLPLAIATEEPVLWGKSKYRLIQLGHLHSSKKRVYQSEDEFNGVIVRHFSSLSGTDQWHDKNNFINNNKKATALVFNENEIGIVAEYNHTV